MHLFIISGMWKGRFRILDKSTGVMEYAPDKVCKVVLATGILHNWLLELGDEGDQEVVDPDIAPGGGGTAAGRAAGERRRDILLQDYLRARGQHVSLRPRE